MNRPVRLQTLLAVVGAIVAEMMEAAVSVLAVSVLGTHVVLLQVGNYAYSKTQRCWPRRSVLIVYHSGKEVNVILGQITIKVPYIVLRFRHS